MGASNKSLSGALEARHYASNSNGRHWVRVELTHDPEQVRVQDLDPVLGMDGGIIV